MKIIRENENQNNLIYYLCCNKMIQYNNRILVIWWIAGIDQYFLDRELKYQYIVNSDASSHLFTIDIVFSLFLHIWTTAIEKSHLQSIWQLDHYNLSSKTLCSIKWNSSRITETTEYDCYYYNNHISICEFHYGSLSFQ